MIVGSDAAVVLVDCLGRQYSAKPGRKPSAFVGAPIRVRLSVEERTLAAAIASEDETTLSDVIREALTAYATRRRRSA